MKKSNTVFIIVFDEVLRNVRTIVIKNQYTISTKCTSFRIFIEILELLKSQFIVYKATFRVRLKGIIVYIVFEVLLQMIYTFERDHRRNVIAGYRDIYNAGYSH